MPETRRKFDPEFREGAVRIVRESTSRSPRLLGTWVSTRALSVTGSPTNAPDATARRACRPMTSPSSSGYAARSPSCEWSAMF